MTTNEILVKTGAEIVFGAVATWNPADNGTNMSFGDAITNEMGMSAIANGAAVHSIKIDLGATRGARYTVSAAFDFTGEVPIAEQSVDLYWAPSPSGIGANANVAGNSGADAAAVDGPTTTGITVAEFVLLCQFIGSFVVTDDATVQAGHVGIFSPAHRYGQMVCWNNAGDVFEADEVEVHIVMTPLIDDVQAAA